MASVIQMAPALALQATQDLHAKTSAPISAALKGTALKVHASVSQAGQVWIVPFQFVAVATGIAPFQTHASATKAGWVISVR
jgi:hypothetical protein